MFFLFFFGSKQRKSYARVDAKHTINFKRPYTLKNMYDNIQVSSNVPTGDLEKTVQLFTKINGALPAGDV